MILAYLENQCGQLPKSALSVAEAVAQCRNAGYEDKTAAVIIGEGPSIESAANQAAFLGFDEVVFVEDLGLKDYLPGRYQYVMEQVCAQLDPSLIISAHTTCGKDFMPRVAVAIDAAQASDVVEFPGPGIFRRPMYAGDLLADVEIKTAKKIVTIRASSFEPAAPNDRACTVRRIQIDRDWPKFEEYVSCEKAKQDRPDLADANVVVSGGKGLKNKENFDTILTPLAASLNAAIGASRAAVDAGFVANDSQVGQTGKIVAPDLYIAVGISGAIQHLAGMKNAKVIVAINNNPDEPIFDVADYGLVADLFEAVPELTRELNERS